MAGFADSTSVSPEKTKAEIETTLRRYGADQFASGWEADRAYVAFRCKDRMVRFVLALPSRTDWRFIRDARANVRPQARQEAEYDQAVRSAWRRLLLVIKAKLESVASNIETFEESFLAQIVLPDGATVGQWAATALPEAYATKAMPQSLLALPAASADR